MSTTAPVVELGADGARGADSVRVRPASPLFSHDNRSVIAVTVSSIGDWLTTLALMTVFGTRLGIAGPALYMACRVIPRPLGSVLGGRLTDRFGSVRVAARISTLLALITFALAVTLVSAPMWVVCTLVVVGQLSGAAVLTSLLVAIPTVAGDARAQRALATCNLTTSAAMIIAPPVSALLLVSIGPTAVVVIDALSFAVAGLFMATIPNLRAPQSSVSATPWRKLAHDAVARVVLAGRAVTFALVTVVQASLLAVAVSRFGSSAALGALYCAMGLGAVVGSYATRRRAVSSAGIVAALILEITAYGVAVARLAGALALTVLFVAAAAGSVHQVAGAARLSGALPPAQRGLAMAALTATGQVGLIGGSLVALVWPGLAVVAAVAVAALAIVLALAPALIRRRALLLVHTKAA